MQRANDSEDRPRFLVREELVRDPRFVRLRAFDTLLECEVTLEQPGEAVLDRLHSADGQRAMREARALSRIQHPRVLRLRDVVDLGGTPTLVLDPIPGERLDSVLARDGHLAADAVLRIGRDLAQATQAVHAEGIVHRGIAAENVVIDARDGGAVLAGFTFAKPVDVKVGQSSLDHAGRVRGGPAVRGLPEYAAPEQVAGQPADHRADVFGLGCLLYRCATGREAFPPDALHHGPPPAPRAVDRSIPRSLSDVIVRCIAHSPTARFPNMLALDDALDAIQRATLPKQGPEPSSWIVGASLAATVTAVAALAVVVALGSRSSDDHAGLLQDFVPRSPEWRLADANPVGALAPTYRQRRAVLIGIDYVGSPFFDDRRLQNAELDVLAVQEQLHLLGWRDYDAQTGEGEVRTLVGSKAGLEPIHAALQWAREADRDAQVLVYLAGHGLQLDRNDPGDGHFVPYGGDADAPWTLISFHDAIHGLLLGKGDAPKHVLVALDCCHSGAAIPDRGRPPYAYRNDILPSALAAEHLTRRARILLTSALGNEVASDGARGEHSPFARGFLEALRRGIQEKLPVLASEIYVSVYREIDRVAPSQCPWRTDVTDGGVEFVFLPPQK